MAALGSDSGHSDVCSLECFLSRYMSQSSGNPGIRAKTTGSQEGPGAGELSGGRVMEVDQLNISLWDCGLVGHKMCGWP